MNQKNTFAINQKIHGRMPTIKKWANNDSKDEIEPIGETIPFEGVMKRILGDGKVETFQLTKPINIETEATQTARGKRDLLVELGDIISVNDLPGWDIKLMPSD